MYLLFFTQTTRMTQVVQSPETILGDEPCIIRVVGIREDGMRCVPVYNSV